MGKNKTETPFWGNLGSIVLVAFRRDTFELSPTTLAHPGGDTLAGALGEGAAEGSVSAEAALLRQFLSNDGLTGSSKFLVALNKVVDALTVDIDIIGNALPRKILAEIVAVGADGLSQLLQREVVLQVELRDHTVLFQLFFNIRQVNGDRRC